MNSVIPNLKNELDKQKRLLENGDSLGFIEITHNFERCIIEGVGNSMLVKEYDSKETLMSFISTYYSDNNLDSLKKVYSQHENIYNLIKDRKLEETVLALREHYYNPEL